MDHADVPRTLAPLRLAVALARGIPSCGVQVRHAAGGVTFGPRPAGSRPLDLLAHALRTSLASGDVQPVARAVGGAADAEVRVRLVHGFEGARPIGAGVYEARTGDRVVCLFATVLPAPAALRAIREAEGYPDLLARVPATDLGVERPSVVVRPLPDVGATLVAMERAAVIAPVVAAAVRAGMLAAAGACLVGELLAEVQPAGWLAP